MTWRSWQTADQYGLTVSGPTRIEEHPNKAFAVGRAQYMSELGAAAHKPPSQYKLLSEVWGVAGPSGVTTYFRDGRAMNEDKWLALRKSGAYEPFQLAELAVRPMADDKPGSQFPDSPWPPGGGFPPFPATHAYVHAKVQELILPVHLKGPVETAALDEITRKGFTQPADMLFVILDQCRLQATAPGQCEVAPEPRSRFVTYPPSPELPKEHPPRPPYTPSPVSPQRAIIDAVVEELTNLDRPNVATARRVLRDLVKKGIDRDMVEEIESYLEDVVSIVRTDYSDPEEYQEARQEAWDGFVAEIENLDLDDDEDEGEEPEDTDAEKDAWWAARGGRPRGLASHEPHPIAAHFEDQAPGTQITDYLHPAAGGIVVDPGLARSTPCIAIELGDRRLVYSRGIIGALDAEEEAAYCAEGFIEHKPTPGQLARIEALTAAAPKCAAENPAVDEFLTCLGQELKAQGMHA